MGAGCISAGIRDVYLVEVGNKEGRRGSVTYWGQAWAGIHHGQLSCWVAVYAAFVVLLALVVMGEGLANARGTRVGVRRVRVRGFQKNYYSIIRVPRFILKQY